jgi:regulator of sigma E protease
MSIILTILASILVFGAVIFIHELGHFITAKLSGITVHEFSMGMGPRLTGFKKGGTAYNLRLFPIGGFVSMEGEDEESDQEGSFSKAPVGKRILVIVAGAIMNIVLGFALTLGLVASNDYVMTRSIGQFDEGAVTYETGLRDKDEILAINGRKLYTTNDIFYEVMRLDSPTADVLVRRAGEKVLLEDVRFDITETDTGYNEINIDFKIYWMQPTLGNVLKEASLQTVSLARVIYTSLFDLVTGRVPINQLSGPVGIVTIISEAVAVDFASVLNLMALISINLGVFNLLPLPALDGGKLLLLIIEAVFRRKIPQKYEIAINIAGFALLIGLMVFVTVMDVSKLFAG